MEFSSYYRFISLRDIGEIGVTWECVFMKKLNVINHLDAQTQDVNVNEPKKNK